MGSWAISVKGEVVMISPSNSHDVHEDVESGQLESLLAIAFGPRLGDPGYGTSNYESNLANATAVLKKIDCEINAKRFFLENL
jgi:hypothetical protein